MKNKEVNNKLKMAYKSMKESDSLFLLWESGNLICGNEVEVVSHLSRAIYVLRKNGIDDDILRHAIELGFADEEELESKAMEALDKLIEVLKDVKNDNKKG